MHVRGPTGVAASVLEANPLEDSVADLQMHVHILSKALKGGTFVSGLKR